MPTESLVFEAKSRGFSEVQRLMDQIGVSGEKAQKRVAAIGQNVGGVKAVTREFGVMNAAQVAAVKSAANLNTVLDKTGTSATQVSARLRDANGRFKSTTASAKETAKAVDNTSTAFKKTGDSVKAASTAGNGVSAVFKKLGASATSMGKSVSTAATALGTRFKSAAASATAGAKSASTAFVKLGASAKASTSSVSSMGTALSGLAIGTLLKGSVRAFADFEARLIGIGKTTGIAGRELEGLGQDIQGLARTLPVATNELLEIGQSAGQLGVQGRDNILKFAETVGRIGLATDLAGEAAATAFARILTVTGQPQSNVDRLGAALVQLGNNFAATESEIAHVATRVGQATSQFDLNTAAVLGISTALKALGVRAELGGSVVGRAFLEMNAAIRGGGEEMRALQNISGLTASQLERDFRDRPEVVFRAFIEGLGRVKASGGDVTAALESMGLKGNENVSVLATLASRSDVLTDALDQSARAWQENTALIIESDAAARSFRSEMQLMQNRVAEVGTALGRELAPSIRSLSEAFAPVAKFLIDNIEAVKVTVVALTAAVAVGLTAAFVGLIGTVGLVAGGLALLAGGTVAVLNHFFGAEKEASKLDQTSAELAKTFEDVTTKINDMTSAQLLNTRSGFVASLAAIDQQIRLTSLSITELQIRRNELILRRTEGNIADRWGLNIKLRNEIKAVDEALAEARQNLQNLAGRDALLAKQGIAKLEARLAELGRTAREAAETTDATLNAVLAKFRKEAQAAQEETRRLNALQQTTASVLSQSGSAIDRATASLIGAQAAQREWTDGLKAGVPLTENQARAQQILGTNVRLATFELEAANSGFTDHIAKLQSSTKATDVALGQWLEAGRRLDAYRASIDSVNGANEAQQDVLRGLEAELERTRIAMDGLETATVQTETAFDGASRGATEFFANLGSTADRVATLVKGGFQSMEDQLATFFETGKFGAEDFFGTLRSLASRFFAQELIALVEGGQSTLLSFFTSSQEGATQTASVLTETSRAAFDAIASGSDTTAVSVASDFGSIEEGGRGLFGTLTDLADGFRGFMVDTVWPALKSGAEDFIGGARESFREFFTGVQGDTTQFSQSIPGLLGLAVGALGGSIIGAVSKGIDVVKRGFKFVTNLFADGGLVEGLATGGQVQGYASGGATIPAGSFVINAASTNRYSDIIGALGGVGIKGPGTGTSDSILASTGGSGLIAVSNGESFIPPAATKKYGGLVKAINDGGIKGFAEGGSTASGRQGLDTSSVGNIVDDFNQTPQLGPNSPFGREGEFDSAGNENEFGRKQREKREAARLAFGEAVETSIQSGLQIIGPKVLGSLAPFAVGLVPNVVTSVLGLGKALPGLDQSGLMGRIVGGLAESVPFLGSAVRALDNLDELGAEMRGFAERHGLSFVPGNDPNSIGSGRQFRDNNIFNQTRGGVAIQPRARAAQDRLLGNFQARSDTLGQSLVSGANRLGDVIRSINPERGGAFDAPSFAGARRFGGPVLAGRDYVVGENGPETVRFPRDGVVTPNPRDGGGSNDNEEVVRAIERNTKAVERLIQQNDEIIGSMRPISKAADRVRMGGGLVGKTA